MMVRRLDEDGNRIEGGTREMRWRWVPNEGWHDVRCAGIAGLTLADVKRGWARRGHRCGMPAVPDRATCGHHHWQEGTVWEVSE